MLRTPVEVIVTSWGGENVTQRTKFVDVTSMTQAMFPVGETNAPFEVTECRGDETTTIAVPVTSSGVQEGGGAWAETASRNWYAPGAV